MNTSYVDKESETLFPPTEPLATDMSVEGDSGNPGFSSQVRAALCYCGGTATVLNDFMFSTNSMEGPDEPPLLQIHGTADPLIPIARALEVFIRADEVEIPTLFYTMQDATHCPWFFPLQDSWLYLDTLIDYTVPFLFAAIASSTSTVEEELLEIDVYPVPSSGDFFVEVKNGGEVGGRIEIYSSLGIIVYQNQINFNQRVSIDLDVPKGTYFLNVISHTGNRYVRPIFIYSK